MYSSCLTIVLYLIQFFLNKDYLSLFLSSLISQLRKEYLASLAVYKQGHQTLAVHELPKAFRNMCSLFWLL